MSKIIYAWERFWRPRGEKVIFDQNGYLYNPNTEYGKYYNHNLANLYALSKIQCLILLGEPGSGKSHELNKHYIASSKYCDLVSYINLSIYDSGSDLRATFENEFNKFRKTNSNSFMIFIDSLDEGMLNIKTLMAVLKDIIYKNLDILQYLYIRIACRTAEWQYSGFEDTFVNLWTEDRIKVYEISPLSQIDVIKAATSNGIDANAFLKEIDRTKTVSLAIKPITLNFLINIYLNEGKLLNNQRDLYYEGCKILCNENNSERYSPGYTRELGIEQKLAIAERIAAITVFTNKNTIYTSIIYNKDKDQEISIKDLCGNTEFAYGNSFNVDEKEIIEVLATGLFCSYGVGKLGWVHRSYAEFLAAHYLIRNNMPLKQKMNLIIHPEVHINKIIPQLYETTAWLAGMDLEVFRNIMEIEPDILLRSDITNISESDKELLVEVLLKLFDEEKLLDDLDKRKYYVNLNHTNIATQLRPYLCNNKGIIARRVAVDIAEACNLNELQFDILTIVFDKTQPMMLRVNAAHAITEIGSIEAKLKLKPLLIDNNLDDIEDELKGYALMSLWPDFLTADELFKSLTSPKNKNLIGAYRIFVLKKVTIKVSDIPIAFQWIREMKTDDINDLFFKDLINHIIYTAIEYLDLPEVLEAYSKTYVFCENNHKLDQFFNENKIGDDKRHNVLKEIVKILANSKKNRPYSWYRLVRKEDFGWLLNEFKSSKDDAICNIWAKMINWVFDIQNINQIDTIINESYKYPIIATEFKLILSPVQINTREASIMKEEYLKRHEMEENISKENVPSLLEPSPIERVILLLESFNKGDLNAWWRLTLQMTLEPDSEYMGDELENDLTTLPVWKEADDILKSQIINAAQIYITEYNINSNNWILDDTIYRPAYAGYKAFYLLLKASTQCLANISVSVWKKWAETILAYPTSFGISDETIQNQLTSMAYINAPDEIINTLMIIIDKENETKDDIFIIQKVQNCLDAKLARSLLNKSKEEKLKATNMGCLLSMLLEHSADGSIEYANELITFNLSEDTEQYRKAVISARLLMIYTNDAGWKSLWPIFQKNADFGRDVITEVANDYDKNIYINFLEDQLANLYIWIEEQYPYSNDPNHINDKAFWMSSRDKIVDFREGVLQHLKNRGTKQSCDAIEKIIDTFPSYKGLKWVLKSARDLTNRQTWLPPTASNILAIVHDFNKRIVHNEEQLTDVIIESLDRLEVKLYAETPAVVFLWDQYEKKFRPKDENRFSDFIKLHLIEDLKKCNIIINREVEIRPYIGDLASSGERIDLLVNAISEKTHDLITVIVEVKGCWNSELYTAMGSQLCNRYLKDNICKSGIYLIGWFNCNQWDCEDYRQNKAPKINIDEAKELFKEQAVKLSTNGLHISAYIMKTGLR